MENFRRVVALVVLPMLVVLSFIYDKPFNVEERLEAARVEEKTLREKAALFVAQVKAARAFAAVDDIQYVKDLRTGLCFAHYDSIGVVNGPVLATVACENIPPHLLAVTK